MAWAAGIGAEPTTELPRTTTLAPPPIDNETEEDRDLLAAARDGDADAAQKLLHKHRGLARAKAIGFFAPGATQEDILQEAMIGLFKAIRSYDLTTDVPFTAFARMCIKRHLSTTVKIATRLKQQPLNSSVSIDGTRSWARIADAGYIDLRDTSLGDPSESLIAAEQLEAVKDLLTTGLTDLEGRVAAFLVQGKSYEDIAELVGSHAKAVDNAIQRLRRKLRKGIDEQDVELKVRENPDARSCKKLSQAD